MHKTGKKSLALHKKHKGKMEIASKVPLKSLNDLSLAYTPGVGEVCLKIARDPKSAWSYSIKGNTVAVITDGSAVLGYGNIGALAGLPVMEGKCILHKALAGTDAFPICLDTQDTEKIIETVKLLSPVFGAIQLEDISAPRCFEIEKRLRAELDIPVLHDDQHCTAVTVLAALINSVKISGLNKSKTKIVISGAGAAGIAITRLLMKYGFKNLTVLDSKGIIYSGRQNLETEKKQIAKLTNHKKIKGDLSIALKDADVFIGVSKGGILKPTMVKLMNKKPIIFALSNPVPEIMPSDAKKAGAYIIATGRSDFPNQINNVLTFPGLFRGALDNRVKIITDDMLIRAAENIAKLVKHPTPNQILPSLFEHKVVKVVAKAIN